MTKFTYKCEVYFFQSINVYNAGKIKYSKISEKKFELLISRESRHSTNYKS